MGSNDRAHFEDYRAQTQVKHEILQAYLAPYFQIVGTRHNDLNYVDGFAGPRTYKKESTGEICDGSPLRALKLIAGSKTFSEKVQPIFIELDKKLFGPLEEQVAQFSENNPQVKKPLTFCCSFAEGVQQVLDKVTTKLAPTFLFADPCGVSGTSFDTIRNVMKNTACEAFIFFNIAGIKRIAGVEDLKAILVELLGSASRADKLHDRFQKNADATARERMILAAYRDALREDMGVKYTIPFRVESEDKECTSHYLIHACNHHLGFKIMKEVMWKRGHSEDGRGGLEFVQAGRIDYIPMFDLKQDEVKSLICKALEGGTKCVNYFYHEWVYRPEDLLCQPAYKVALLELEADGEIEILDKDGRTPKPVDKRPRPKGKATLGEGYFARLKSRAG